MAQPQRRPHHLDFPIDLSRKRIDGNKMPNGKQQQQQASKRTLTLDFDAKPSAAKRTRLSANGQHQPQPPILTTPDVQMLKLSSPELAKFLSGQNGLPTPTPSGYAFPKTITEEQELYAKGFEDALKNVQQQTTTTTAAATSTAITTIERATQAHKSAENNLSIAASAIAAQPPLPVASSSSRPSRPSSGASGSIEGESSDGYSLPDPLKVKLEEEDDDSVASGPSSAVSPIDMASQEKIKLERKRQRNRVAASKCRRRKLERIAQLDDKVKQLKGENGELAAVVKKLKESVMNLKAEVIEHMNNGCQIMIAEGAAL